MRVVFLAPAFPPEMQDFTRGLAEVGAEVIGVGEGAPPESLRRHLSGWIRVPALLDEVGATEKVVAALQGVRVDRVEGLWEPVVLLAARLREALGVPGMSRDTVLGFRDKEVMKERLRRGGVRVPRSRRARSQAEVRAAAEEVGFPLVVKPISGAGSADTYRCGSLRDLEAVLAATRHVREVSVEEYIEGDELTWDAVVIRGRPAFESVTQYFPKPIVARNEEWISPAQLTYADPTVPGLAQGGVLGREALAALGMGTGFIHMEWFRTPSGEAVLGEIACRSGGGHLVDQMNWVNDFDIYREWARSVCWESFEGRPSRRYHCGMVFKRAQGQGRVRHIAGLEAFRRELGAAFIGHTLTPVGSPRRSWKASLVGDGGIAFRHPDLEVCQRYLARAVRDVTLYAG